MRKTLSLVVAVSLAASSVLPVVAGAAALREGDSFKVRLGYGISGSNSNGDTISVTLPEAFQADPKGPPVLAAGVAGFITLKMGEKTGDGAKFDVTQFTFMYKGKHVVVPAHLADPAAGIAKSQSASIIKKLLLPPLLGFLIWHDSSTPGEGSDLNIEVTKSARW